MDKQNLKEYAKSASPDYEIICKMVGHICYEDGEEIKCARCGRLFEGKEREEVLEARKEV